MTGAIGDETSHLSRRFKHAPDFENKTLAFFR
jgi:hypothetical protein